MMVVALLAEMMAATLEYSVVIHEALLLSTVVIVVAGG